MHDLNDLLEDAQRQITVCNACRYCEGYCAAFPAMELRGAATTGDLGYIANLCHDCRACYQACPYTPPHEFNINIPALLSEARVSTYAHYTRPTRLARAFANSRFTISVVVGITTLALGLIVGLGATGGLKRGRTGDFYGVISYGAMLIPALLISLYAGIVISIGCVRFFRDARSGSVTTTRRQLLRTAGDIVMLRWMRGGGGGCHYPNWEDPSSKRRWLHQLLVGGFATAFLATVAAAIEQDILGLEPPYPVLSVPVVLGSTGGIMLVAATAGLIAFKRRDVSHLGTPRARALDKALLWSLAVVAITGIGLLVLRRTAAMGPALVIHLAAVAVLFLLIPYGKFVHAGYRTAALLLMRSESRAEDGAGRSEATFSYSSSPEG
jgi:citrate/tricarballylate utilization protein